MQEPVGAVPTARFWRIWSAENKRGGIQKRKQGKTISMTIKKSQNTVVKLCRVISFVAMPFDFFFLFSCFPFPFALPFHPCRNIHREDPMEGEGREKHTRPRSALRSAEGAGWRREAAFAESGITLRRHWAPRSRAWPATGARPTKALGAVYRKKRKKRKPTKSRLACLASQGRRPRGPSLFLPAPAAAQPQKARPLKKQQREAAVMREPQELVNGRVSRPPGNHGARSILWMKGWSMAATASWRASLWQVVATANALPSGCERRNENLKMEIHAAANTVPHWAPQLAGYPSVKLGHH